MEINHHYLSSDFHLSSVCRRPVTSPSAHQNSRKKRTRIGSSHISKPKPVRKADPAAPNITRLCTECGKKFWSWKALFGHMRCHPERQWRGINPPPNFRRPEMTSEDSSSVTEEDHEVATCLLMLANGPVAEQSPSVTVSQATLEYSDCVNLVGVNCDRFESSSCKKVLGSDSSGHKCSTCFRVFSSGQALGGHMRCHWEKKVDEPSRVCGGIDLNLSAAHEDDASSPPPPPCSSGGLALDLRLGL